MNRKNKIILGNYLFFYCFSHAYTCINQNEIDCISKFNYFLYLFKSYISSGLQMKLRLRNITEIMKLLLKAIVVTLNGKQRVENDARGY